MLKNYKNRIDSYAYEIGMDLVSDIFRHCRWGWAGEKLRIQNRCPEIRDKIVFD